MLLNAALVENPRDRDEVPGQKFMQPPNRVVRDAGEDPPQVTLVIKAVQVRRLQPPPSPYVPGIASAFTFNAVRGAMPAYTFGYTLWHTPSHGLTVGKAERNGTDEVLSGSSPPFRPRCPVV